MNAPEARCPDRPRLVLDTNVVLDWLVFDHEADRALGAAVSAGRVCWFTTSAMRDELEHVLTRGALDAWSPDLADVLRRWDLHGGVVEPQAPTPWTAPRCTDPDDQKFIDLAIQCRPCVLLSRDRAVLRCARAAAAHGVTITTPGAWLASQAAIGG